MNWFYWDTGWSFVFGTIAFMTIVSHPDSVVLAYHATEQAQMGKRWHNLRLATLLAPALAALRRYARAPSDFR